MSLPVPVVWSGDCLRHDPAGEVWLGLREPGTEVAARALVLRDALAAAGAPVTAAREHDDTILRRVHDPALLAHLASVWADWEAAGLPAGHGRDRVVPYVFPTPGLLAGLPARPPAAVHGRAGLYCYDTMTLVGPGSWAAIRGAADAAQTAADLVGSGAPVAYALCLATRASRHPRGVRRLLLPQQRRGGGRGAAGRRGGPGRGAGHRRAPRQRHADDLLGPGGRLVRVAAR